MNSSLTETSEARLPSSVTHYCESEKDILVWSNRELSKDIFSFTILPASLFFFPVLLTWLLRRDLAQPLVLVVLVPTWLIAIFLATLIFRRLFWREKLVITDETIILSRTGFWAPKDKRFSQEDILRVSYDRDDLDGGGQNALNIVYRFKLLGVVPGMEAEQLASLSRKRERYQLFLYLQAVLKRRGWSTKDGNR